MIEMIVNSQVIKLLADCDRGHLAHLRGGKNAHDMLVPDPLLLVLEFVILGSFSSAKLSSVSLS